jgi:type I restriction enzyme, S subunit
MKSNYKKLGPYIREVLEKNSQNQIEKLRGVSIQKCFIPSIANTIGTDMTIYKIVRENQFAYGPVTSRNGDKISVALLQESDCIISTSYTVFEIIDHNELLPEYLMMWFRRPEFDRYARFMSHGSVREIFGWEEMCNVELPIPSLEKQKEIVAEYNTIVNRIKLNEQLNRRLEETAQAIYKQWFVDFEFPISKAHAAEIGKPELEGKPYKSSGGKMDWNDELNQEIPDGWRVKEYADVFDFKTGKLNSNAALENGKFPFFTCSSETFKTDTYSFDCEALVLAGNNASAVYPFKYFKGKFDAYQRTYVITVKDSDVSIFQGYFEVLGQLEGFKGTSSGTATKFLTMKILNPIKMIAPHGDVSGAFYKLCSSIFGRRQLADEIVAKLTTFKGIILIKMTKAEATA